MTALFLCGGYDVTACDDGRAALRQLATAHFDLVVTGLVMPNIDGLELIRALRTHHSPPPVIAVADDGDAMSLVYLRNATLMGAAGAHILGPDASELMTNVNWMVTGQADVLKQVVW